MDENAYVDALIQDLDSQHASLSSRTINTVFIGGGTPSLLSGDAYHRLFQHIRTHYTLNDTAEITLEANPGTVDYERFKSYRDIGINRLSIGIQSFNDVHLKKLGRIHSANNAETAINSAKKAGFDNFNLDIMHGLPGQTVAEALGDVRAALSFKPPHLSWYQLTLEPNTIFYKTKPTLPSEGVLADIEEGGFRLLNKYQHYEISAFSQANKHCRHNENYWTFGDYLGIGAGAHSKLTTETGITRFEKKRMPKDYIAAPCININQREMGKDALPFEFMLMVSRLKRPIEKKLFEQRTGQSISCISNPLEEAGKLNLITENEHAIQITEHGFRFLNEFQGLFL